MQKSLPASPLSSSFTAKADGLMREIVLNVGLSPPILPSDPGSHQPKIQVRGLWDTGATGSALTKKAAEQLGLAPIGMTEVHHAKGQSTENVYALSVFLPNRVFIPYVRATECESTAGNFDFIIGMEIITMGDFSITNVGGQTVVSFRCRRSKKLITSLSKSTVRSLLLRVRK